VKVAKHGGRAVSSLSGSPDVFAALGVDLQASAARQTAALEAAGICVLFAPNHHSAMRHVAPVRSELGFRALFNPAGARRQLLGVYDEKLVEPLAQVLGRLGAEHAWVVHGNGLDEITITGQTLVSEWTNGSVRTFYLSPEMFDLPRVDVTALRGGDALENAQAIRDLLDGAHGPYRDIVILNAAAVFVIAGAANDLHDGLTLARRSIDTGAAKAALTRLVALTGLEA
jgi:anthranilate phosphoribosyltransferase